MSLSSLKPRKGTRRTRKLLGPNNFFAFPSYAERKYFLGTAADFTGGMTNQIGDTSYTLSENAPFFAVYPSINLRSVGEHSELDLDYTFSAERFRTSDGITTLSHIATGSFAAQLGNRTHLRISDTFDTMPNYSTINVLQGFTVTPQGFQYVFEPQTYQSFSMSNSGNIGIDVDLTSKSFLTFGGSGSYRHYNDTVNQTYYSDQLRAEGSFGFSHKHSTRTTWGMKYKIWQNDYQDNYPTARSHSATVELRRVLSPGWSLTLEAGPAYVETASYLSYIINANISKQSQTNRFDAGYSHYAGDSTGIGGTSESHQGRLGFSQSLWRTASLSFQASAFRQYQKGSGSYDYWGANGSAALSQELGKYWVASVGVSYTTNMGGGYNGYTYERAYVSIGYRLPDFWRTER